MTVKTIDKVSIGEPTPDGDSYRSDFGRLTTLLRLAEGSWAFAVYEDAMIMQRTVEELRANLAPLPVYNVSLIETELHLLSMLNDLDHPAPIVSFSNAGSVLEQLCVHLDLQREALARLPHRLLLWVTEYDLRYLAEHAPNFYSRISGTFYFPGFSKAVHRSTEAIQRSTADSTPGSIRRRKTVAVPESMGYDALVKYFERRIATLEQMRPPDAHAIGESWSAMASVYEGTEPPQWAEAERAYLKVAYQFECANDQLFQADMLASAGEAARRAYAHDQAMSHLKQALILYRLLDNESEHSSVVATEADVLLSIGEVHRLRGEYDVAEENYEQALSLFRTIGDRLGEATVLSAQGRLALMHMNKQESDARFQESISIYALSEIDTALRRKREITVGRCSESVKVNRLVSICYKPLSYSMNQVYRNGRSSIGRSLKKSNCPPRKRT